MCDNVLVFSFDMVYLLFFIQDVVAEPIFNIMQEVYYYLMLKLF